VDRHVRTIDVLPTVASLLGIDLPWETEGRSALSGPAPRTVFVEGLRRDFSELVRRRDRALEAQVALFGSGEPWSGVFAAGPRAGLLGRRVTRLRPTAAHGVRAVLLEERLLHLVDPDAALPSFVEGTLVGPAARAGHELAIAVEGRVAAVTRSHAEGGAIRFSALLPESVLRPGFNRVDVLALDVEGTALVARSLGGTRREHRLTLVRTEDGTQIGGAGETIRVVPGAVDGSVELAEVEGDDVQLAGWAGDVEGDRSRERIVVFADGEFVLSSDAELDGRRGDLARRFDAPALEDAAFRVFFPARLVTAAPKPRVRVFAVIGTVASELEFAGGNPWPGRGGSR
jgi:hypothetical protein